MKNNNNNNNPYLTDKPVEKIEQDRFERSDFAHRIAETIQLRKNPESLVIGLYGPWGEGKSSVLNFIKTQLTSKNIITVSYNPWRLDGEDLLLKGFFTELAYTLNKSLKTKGERAGEIIAQYAEAVIPKLEFFDGAVATEPGAHLKKIGELLAETTLNELKSRIETFLRTEKKSIVVIIDDIDRLNKYEIQTIFRLVKLTANFDYVTYILSFDESVVSRSIGEMYGGDDIEKSGRNFLEKIIQVPLYLPKIQEDTMYSFFYDKISEVISSTNAQITNTDMNRFETAIRDSILPRITTPRHVIRYYNILSVILPILSGEANAVDLMLIEALHVFYPESYKLISDNHNNITGTLKGASINDLKKNYESKFGKNGADFGESLTLVCLLFPKLKSAFADFIRSIHLESLPSSDDELYEKQSIASHYYFKRYFSYAVQKGEVPDNLLNQLYKSINENNLTAANTIAIKIIEQSNDEEFLRRLRAKQSVDLVNITNANNYFYLITGLETSFKNRTFTRRAMRIVSPANDLLLLYLELIPDELKINNILHLIESSKSFEMPFSFVKDLERVLIHVSLDGFTKIRGIITDDNFVILTNVLISKMLNINTKTPWYTLYNTDIYYFLELWHRSSIQDRADENIKRRISKDPNELLSLFRNLAIQGTIGNKPFHGNITKDEYKNIKKYFDVDYLYKKSIDLIANDELLPYQEDVFYIPESNLERLHQFVHLYNHDEITKNQF
ncbi:KAP family P-loop NTPase fold protein [Hymenobacter puniceus]|uniref:KAP family P-loop NTPase fold protein n=1 Tax=Hymenobacter sp. BT190 TaxID=2763505 RepID=UPI0016518258|nr:P-loop NTPase fold protein [Hymenobacter sp. BT190]MBC6698907.1 hypothetical protein [Hymenobacter sp. BT190]